MTVDDVNFMAGVLGVVELVVDDKYVLRWHFLGKTNAFTLRLELCHSYKTLVLS